MSLSFSAVEKTREAVEGHARTRVKVALFSCVCLAVLAAAGVILRAEETAGQPSVSSRLVPFLEQTISWYRQSNLLQEIVTEPSDTTAFGNSRQVSGQIVRLSFDFAKTEADATPNVSGATQNQSDNHSTNLLQMEGKIEKQIADNQAEQNSARQKMEATTGKKKQDLQSQVAELQGEIDLANAKREAVHNMIEFVSGSNTNGTGTPGLRAQIDALASSVPGVLDNPSTGGQVDASKGQTSTSTLNVQRSSPSGMWDLAVDLFTLSAKVRTIDGMVRRTKGLARNSKEIRTPLIQSLLELSKQGDQLAQAADSAHSVQLEQQKKQLDVITGQFKQLSAAVLPLSKQGMLLDLYLTNLSSWRETVQNRFVRELRGLLIRLLFLGVLLGLLIAAAEAWRRAIFRYVHEPRRRHQFLILRKFVLWFSIALVIALAFASKLGSIATFAGLLTAGVAVALQNVILAVVGYFFLIGKFGIRVGDRVQIGGVTGEVLEIGLVRMHLMELGGAGWDIPTGRIVAFANSVAFQPAAGLFKQIPGTNFVWHEIALTLAADTDYSAVKEKLIEAAETALADYRGELERQHHAMENNFSSISFDGFKPKAKLQYTSSNLEAVISFPADLQHAAEIDERVMAELRKALGKDLKLKVSGANSPNAGGAADVPAETLRG